MRKTIGLVCYFFSAIFFLNLPNISAGETVEKLALGEKTAQTSGWDTSTVQARQETAKSHVDAQNEISNVLNSVAEPESTSKKSFEFTASYSVDAYAEGQLSVKYDGLDTVKIGNYIPKYSTPYYMDVIDLKTGVITVVSIQGISVYQPGDLAYAQTLSRDISTVQLAIKLATDHAQEKNLEKILKALVSLS